MTTSDKNPWEGPIETRTPEQRRLRAEHAGEIMAEPLPLNKSSSRVLAQQIYSVPGKTEEERVAIERGTKPGPVGRWFGYVVGTVVAGGVVTLVAILIGKAIVWAWNL